MGKHSSDSQLGFYRSVVGWALPWVLIAAGVAIGVWVAVNALGGGGEPEPGRAAAQASPSSAPQKVAAATPSTRPSPASSSTKEEAEPDPKSSPEVKGKLITRGMTVQVLNATGNTEADDRMASKLAALGFDVIAIDDSSRTYAETTVFWSYSESTKAGEALAGRFGWSVGPKPSNLSTTVALHVIVGEDFL